MKTSDIQKIASTSLILYTRDMKSFAVYPKYHLNRAIIFLVLKLLPVSNGCYSLMLFELSA